MIQILIILVVIGLIYSLLENLAGWVKERLSVIAGIILLIAIIAGVIALARFLLPIVIENLPAVLICSFILIAIYFAVTKAKRRSYIAWVERVGFGRQDDAPGSKRIWKWANAKGYADGSESGYVWSVGFYNYILNDFYARQTVTAAVFQNVCMQAAPSFNPEYTLAFLDCLKLRKILMPIDEAGKETVYLSIAIISDCERLFEIEGGATEEEFSQICEASMGSVPVNPKTLAKFILENMVSQGAAEKVKLEGCPDGETLFVLEGSKIGSKMECKEINLDD